MGMNYLIIHDPRLVERRAAIQTFLEKNPKIQPVNWVTEDLYPEAYSYNPELFKEKVGKLWGPQHKPRKLSAAEISCTNKHIESCYDCQYTNKITVVLEDDVISCVPDLHASIEALIEAAPAGWGAIFFGEGVGPEFRNQKLREGIKVNDKLTKIQHPASNCTEAMIFKPSLAKKLFKELSREFHLVIDFELGYWFDKLDAKIYWSNQALVRQGSKCGATESAIR